MKVETMEEEKVAQLKVGDVVKVNANFYLVIKVDTKYQLRNFSGGSHLTGNHNSLELLLDSLGHYEFKILSKDKFKLKIVEIEGGNN